MTRSLNTVSCFLIKRSPSQTALTSSQYFLTTHP